MKKNLKVLEAVLLNFETNQNKLNFLDVVRNCIPLSDPEGVLEDCKQKAKEYPAELQKKIIEENIAFFVAQMQTFTCTVVILPFCMV